MVSALVLLLAAAAAPTADAGHARPPVVFVALDEFPVDSLLDKPRHIDRVRYPAFGALAADATWFPNAHAAHDLTTYALPALLDARRPRPGVHAHFGEHRHNLFTLFHRHRYKLRVQETETRLCPREWCGTVPPLDLTHHRSERFMRFVSSIRRGRPTLWFQHAVLPHNPWLFLPSGKRYADQAGEWGKSLSRPNGFHDQFLTDQNQQRYLLQVGFTDRLLGHLLARLRRLRIYDDALIVVVADHGISFDVGVKDRRSLTGRNIDEVAPIPVFIKAPHQRSGRINPVVLRATDVLPTVARILHWHLGWRTDGRPASSRVVRQRRRVRMTVRDFSHVVDIKLSAFNRRRRANLRRRLGLFGSGRESLFRIGPHPELLGRSPASLPAAAPGATQAVIGDADAYRSVDLTAPQIPIWFAGELRGPGSGGTRSVAVSVNGRIAATGRTFHLDGEAVERFSMLFPEDSLRQGENDVSLYEITGRGLAPLGSAG